MTDTEMPDVFDALTEKAQSWAREFPEPPEFELASDRELTCTDPAGRVQVTMKDFAVASIHIDDTWHAESMPGLMEVEQAVKAAVNVTLSEYWTAELADAKAHHTPMGEIAAGLEKLSVEFRGAYENAVARLEPHDE
jgi:hypothetical protein